MKIPYSQITPQHVYLSRRRFLAGAGVIGAQAVHAAKLAGVKQIPNASGERVTPADIVTTYNNYYEFGTGKDEPAKLSQKWTPDPNWKIEISGEVAKPKTLGIEDILKLAPLEERVYRHRCVEMWSVVVPWVGFSLSVLLRQVEPTSRAKYVAFETHYDPKVMLSSRQAHIDLPYIEGLRLDEAMHPLTMLAAGAYGETLLNQNGAPLRLVVPWKYGFKSIKSITKIRFVASTPPTTWNLSWPEAYGFYSNVNPKVDHPRNGPQNRERRLGEGKLGKMIATKPFNGYAEVAGLYSGMDLVRNY
jgi:sulfoxide reductase catalytic subunit YedY